MTSNRKNNRVKGLTYKKKDLGRQKKRKQARSKQNKSIKGGSFLKGESIGNIGIIPERNIFPLLVSEKIKCHITLS